MRWTASILIVVLALLCFGAAGLLHAPMRAIRAARTPVARQRLPNASPLVAFTTVALGGFRGVLADILWVRAVRLQEDGQYFEIVQLADWITKLEPEFTAVWAYHAWNMAYNVSVVFPDPEDRWRWVDHGIRLLRDDGLKANAGDPALYRELAWLYQHKIGARWDSAHMYYRRRLIEQVGALFPGPRPDYAALAAEAPPPRRFEDVGLRPDVMREIERKYGDLDWRLPETHAVYWAWRGLQAARGNSLDCSRVIFQSMAALFHQGLLIHDSKQDLLLMLPDTRRLWSTVEAYEDACQRYRNETVADALANFLNEAMFDLYALGERDELLRLYDLLKKKFPERSRSDCDSYVEHLLSEEAADMTAPAMAQNLEEMVSQAAVWRSMGNPKRASAVETAARRLWERASARAGESGAAALPSFDTLKQEALERLAAEAPGLTGAAGPASGE